MINGEITRQSVQISFNNLFYIFGWITIGLVAVVWLAKPPFIKSGTPAAAAGGGH
jgi:DHA2 family multidrug resistance protein